MKARDMGRREEYAFISVAHTSMQLQYGNKEIKNRNKKSFEDGFEGSFRNNMTWLSWEAILVIRGSKKEWRRRQQLWTAENDEAGGVKGCYSHCKATNWLFQGLISLGICWAFRR